MFVMSKTNLFEIAVRNKYRFPFRGLVSVEDLWDLSVENLDVIFKELNSQRKRTQEESLLGTKTTQDKELEVKIDIVKYIVSIKLDEAELRSKSKERKAQQQKIMEIIASKQDQALENMSLEELQRMLNELEG
jgi:trehalose/maltose hydrolase-like predicted phosphorylase